MSKVTTIKWTDASVMPDELGLYYLVLAKNIRTEETDIDKLYLMEDEDGIWDCSEDWEVVAWAKPEDITTEDQP